MLIESEVQARLEREHIKDVDGFHVTVREDSTGDVAAFICAVVPDGVREAPGYFEKSKRIEDQVFDIFKREFPGYWPYVRFRSLSEMAAP